MHLVMGGRVKDPTSLEFADLKAIDFVGVFPNYGRPKKPGVVPPSARSTMPRCAMSSCICTGCSTRKQASIRIEESLAPPLKRRGLID